MYFVEKTIPDKFNLDNNLPNNFDRHSSAFFDIETTGLSPKTSYIFLIGLLFFKEDKLILRQYFADNVDDEANILNNFIEDISHYENLYNFNGTSFDIPFIIKRLIVNSINFDFSKHIIIDIYKTLLANKQMVYLESYKLKNVEKYLNIIRKDELSGSQIVSEYKNFIEFKNVFTKQKILLHNEEDVINLYRILPILNIIENINSCDISDINEIDIKIDNKKVYITGKAVFKTDSVSVIEKNYTFNYDKSTNGFFFLYTILEDTLYYIFNNYKQYYYFPDIDCAIHKSVAKYNKNQTKLQATKANCYSKINTQYIELPTSIQGTSIKLCTKNPKQPQNCITIDELKKNISTNEIKDLFKLITFKIINIANIR